MRTGINHRTGILAILFLAGAVALWLLAHAAAWGKHDCASQPVENISLIKLI